MSNFNNHAPGIFVSTNIAVAKFFMSERGEDIYTNTEHYKHGKH